MCWGPACSALKKSWFAYKMAGKSGTYRGDIAWRINKIQNAMGIKKSEFPKLPQRVSEELTKEEIQLREEEEEEGKWDLETKIQESTESEDEDNDWGDEFPRLNTP